MKKRILSIVTALALTLALLPAAAAPASAAGAGRTVQVSDSNTFNNAIADLRDGDTLQLTNSFVVTTPTSSNDSLFIDKNVTIDGRGHGLSLRYAGVLLGADVTFKNVSLGLASNVRPALIANGHTLILDGVTRDPTNRNINLFCGSQTGATQGALAAGSQGSHGHIIIKGNTYLGPTGRIFAGSISTDGTNNEFTKPATVTIEPSVTGDPIGEIYACGALETPTSENDWFDYEHEIDPPFASPGNFKVSGNVTFNLYQGKVGKVSGDTGVGGNLAQVNYDGTDYLNDNLLLSNIGGLTVESGNLAPVAGRLELDLANRISSLVEVPGSSFFGSGAPLGVGSRATLGLQNLDSEVYVGDLTGGGALVLGADQKLVVSGAVSGTTTVGIGSIFNGHSQMVPDTNNHVYIDAASSAGSSFTLAAPAGRPDIELVYQTGGIWKAEGGHKSTNSIVDDFALTSVVADPSTLEQDPNAPEGTIPTLWFAVLPFEYVAYAPNSAENPIAFIPLTIKVNGNNTLRVDNNGSFSYRTDNLELAIAGDAGGEELQIYTISPDENQAVALTGPYLIEVTVPAASSGTGQPITRRATLTVKAAEGGTTPILVPAANTGLVYTGLEQVGVPLNDAYTLISGTAVATNAGDYTATVTPANGFTWDVGGIEEKTIFWNIAKADNLRLPARLDVTAPTTYGSSDGTITGTTTEMEYAQNASFRGAVRCGQGETTGLTASDYYVRIAEDTNYNAGPAVLVTVPQGPLTVRSITISSTGHKTLYQVGEPLDVTGLTLTVTMSNNSEYLVPVAAGMVSGFNSSAAAQGQTLTVTYGGKTTTYTISISDGTGTGPIAVTGVTLNKSSTTLTVGSSERLTATVSPNTAANKNVIWASQNTAVATVDAAGTVTAVSAGTAVITVTTEDGGKTASCTVTVSPNEGGGSTGGGPTGGGPTGSGSTSGGSTGSNPTGGDSSSSSNTTVNADGSVTTTVIDKNTGTVTTTTQKTDGSTTVVEAKTDGTVTITDTAKNGVKVEAVSKPETDTSARVTVPADVKTATVTVPVTVTPGMVAVDARTGEIVKLSAPTGDGMVVKLDASADLILEDRSKAFADTDSHWARNAIDFATAHALFNGTSDTTFAPDEPMTRGMVAVVLHNFEGNPGPLSQSNFTDAASGKWYTDAVSWVTEKGIAGGYGNGSFGVEDIVTREQLVTILYRYANAMGYSTEGGADLSAFPDGASVSAYASEAMGWAVGSGLIVSTDGGTLAPGSSATRAQVASILNRFVLNLIK